MVPDRIRLSHLKLNLLWRILDRVQISNVEFIEKVPHKFFNCTHSKLTGAFYVGNGWVAGVWIGLLLLVMTWIISENSLRLAPVRKIQWKKHPRNDSPQPIRLRTMACCPCSHHFWCDFWSNYVKLAMRMPGQFTHKINQQNLFILAAHGLNLDQWCQSTSNPDSIHPSINHGDRVGHYLESPDS